MKENLTRRGAGSNGFTLLASIYLSYVFHLWMEAWRQSDEGDTIVVRYADDAVLGFERCRGTLWRFRRSGGRWFAPGLRRSGVVVNGIALPRLAGRPEPF